MTRPSTLTFLPLLLCLLYGVSTSTSAPVTSTNFIKASCKSTTYPALCVKSLSIYASAIQQSPHQLAHTALNVSLTKAQVTKTFVKKLTKFRGLKAMEYAAIKDCWEEMSDTVDRLTKSVEELKGVGRARGPDFLWRMSNIETWASAALTDESTCIDGFEGRNVNGRIKTSVRIWVTNVAQVTSNALALVNSFAAMN